MCIYIYIYIWAQVVGSGFPPTMHGLGPIFAAFACLRLLAPACACLRLLVPAWCACLRGYPVKPWTVISSFRAYVRACVKAVRVRTRARVHTRVQAYVVRRACVCASVIVRAHARACWLGYSGSRACYHDSPNELFAHGRFDKNVTPYLFEKVSANWGENCGISNSRSPLHVKTQSS